MIAIICTPAPVRAEILFETDFSADTGYSLQGAGVINTNDVPQGWDGVRATGNGKLSVVAGEGMGRSNALKLEWDPNLSQPTITLFKHLTDDPSTGFDELYIRYTVRLPNRFKAGTDGTDIAFWKWGRLWQNTGLTPSDGTWTENRADSFYVVWNFSGAVPFTDTNTTFGANTGSNLDQGSAGGERYLVDYFVSNRPPETQAGYFEHVGAGAWDINDTNRPGELENNVTQTWHTIEYHFKLATSIGANDGLFQMFFDGESQGPPTRIRALGGAPELSGIPTTIHGSGWNLFSFFDNMRNWNREWSSPNVDGFIWVNDVIVSTTRIGDSRPVEVPGFTVQ